MFYFIMEWDKDTSLEKNRLAHIVKQFSDKGIGYRTITLNCIPFFRYKSHYASISLSFKKNISVYDCIQNINVDMGHPLSIEDIYFPDGVEQIFHPKGITLLKKNKRYGEVYFNEYGCIYKVEYISNTYLIVDYYDDRGFISYREIIDSLYELVKREYYNELGDLTISEYSGDAPKVVIEARGNEILQSYNFSTMEEVVKVVINNILENVIVNKKNYGVIELPSTLNSFLNVKKYINNIILVLPDNSIFKNMSKEAKIKVIEDYPKLVADTRKNKKEIKEIQKEYLQIVQSNVVYIPIYNTELSLGFSNSISELIIYLKIDEIEQNNLTLFKSMIKEIIINEDYNLLVQVQTVEQMEILKDVNNQIVSCYFGVDHLSDDYKKVREYILSKKKMKLFQKDEDAIEHIRKTVDWQNLVAAVEAVERLRFLVSPSISQIKSELFQARVFVDINTKNDLHLQSMVVSAGVPMVVNEETDYFNNTKNGLVVNTASEAVDAIKLFLLNLDYWNKSLVESISIIKKNSTDQIIKKWKGLINE